MKPFHAGALVWAQRSAQRIARIGAGPASRLAHCFEDLGEPRPGGDLTPAAAGSFIGAIPDARACKQAHGLGERQTLRLSAAFYRFEVRQRLLQALAVDLHPFAAHERQPIGASQDLADLFFAQRFVIERHLNAEIQERFGSNEGWLRAANRCADFGTRRAVHAPVRGHADNHASAFQGWNVIQKLQRFRRRPAQGIVNFAVVHHRLQPWAKGGGGLDRGQER